MSKQYEPNVEYEGNVKPDGISPTYQTLKNWREDGSIDFRKEGLTYVIVNTPKNRLLLLEYWGRMVKQHDKIKYSTFKKAFNGKK